MRVHTCAGYAVNRRHPDAPWGCALAMIAHSRAVHTRFGDGDTVDRVAQRVGEWSAYGHGSRGHGRRSWRAGVIAGAGRETSPEGRHRPRPAGSAGAPGAGTRLQTPAP